MPALPFIDTHVHFWDLSEPALRWAWLDPGSQQVRGDLDGLRTPRYMAEQFLVETRFQNVAKCIHVQAAIGSPDPVEETRWLQAQADRTGCPHGIVAHCDLRSRDAQRTLERHVAHANVRGVRDVAQGDRLTDPDDPAWRRGYALLARYDLVCCFDVVVAPHNLAKAPALARRHPDVVLCIDHGGVPRAPDADFDAWRRGMRELAAADNVVCKISGFGEVDRRWTVDGIRPWVLTCIELFGAERCVFGTNWPVNRLASSYGDVLDAYDRITAGFSPAERAALFAGNAERIFRI